MSRLFVVVGWDRRKNDLGKLKVSLCRCYIQFRDKKIKVKLPIHFCEKERNKSGDIRRLS